MMGVVLAHVDRDIRDRSILRLFETDEFNKHPINFQSALPLSLSQLSFVDEFGPDAEPPLDFLDQARFMPNSPLSSTTWDDLSYFSEPEFESDNRHIHKAKVSILQTITNISTHQRHMFWSRSWRRTFVYSFCRFSLCVLFQPKE